MRGIPCALIAACAFGATAAAQTYVVTRTTPEGVRGYRDLRISKAALPGQEVRIWYATMLNADCSPAGTMTTQVTEPPRHGDVRVSDEPFHPEYGVANPRVACDAKPAPGKQAFYTARSDFHGHDKVVLQDATSEGRVRKVIIDIDVR